ncbi:amino acid carrier protein [Propioniferax innocua]
MPLTGSSIDAWIQSWFGPVVDVLEAIVFYELTLGALSVPLLVIWLTAGGLFLTLWLRMRPWRDLRHTLDILRGRFSRYDDEGEVTSFQALATELSGTVGLGNIAGVAVAITVGGPGAVFWIIVSGMFGMALKMSEATLAQKYRRVNIDGTIDGGPMYYLRDGLADIGRPRLGRVLALIFGACMMVAATGAGNIFQSNQMTAQIIGATGGEASWFAERGWLIGVVLATVVGIVILGGLKKIAQWTGRITPIMAVLYIGCVLVVLGVNIQHVPESLGLIFSGAFTGEGVTGGVVGVMVVGIQRALFSNAAGVGTAGMAHAATKNRRPAAEGMVASWEPFIDSVVVCTMTALAIIVTGEYKSSESDGVALTTDAFATVHAIFPWLLTVCIALFAFSTVLAFSYYGRKAAGFVFNRSRVAERVYDVVYLTMIVLGSAVTLETVVRFSDALFFLVTIPNLVGIYFLSNVLRREINGHREKVQAGEIDPVPEAERSTIFGRPVAERVTEQPEPASRGV